MRTRFKLFIVSFALLSCARIPSQSIPLMDALIAEGERMHTLNRLFLDEMFDEKGRMVDEFIQKEYTPWFIGEFQKRIPANVDVKAELPGIIAAITPRIAARRDSMQSALETQRRKLVEKLNNDYSAFKNGAASIRKLLDSAIKVDKEREALYGQVKALSNNSLDMQKVEGFLDEFVTKGGKLGEDISQLENSINTILNK